MTFQVTFKVDVIPRGKGRARHARRGNFISTYTDSKTRSYEEIINLAAKQAMGASDPLEGPVDLFVYASMPVPQSYSKTRSKACLEGSERHTKKPDIDNIIKSVMDACQKVVFLNDTQVVNLHATKVYGEPYLEIMVRETECLTLR